jgi:predicted RND superfamily exporter protein
MAGDFEFFCYSVQSVPEELLASFVNDSLKLGGAPTLLFVFCVASVWRRDMSRNKTMVVLTGIGSSIMTIISSIGFGLGFGNPKHVNQLVMFMPFLILAIGMDDMLVLLRSYELTPPIHSSESRIAETMYEGGVSITITSLTDFVGFLGGSFMIDMPAVSDLCLYAAPGVFLIYAYTITVVLSIMVGQAKREDGSKNCCNCRFC